VESNAALDELLSEISELRPLPAVAARAITLTEGDQFSAHELAQAISADQALSAKMLRLANSAYYGFPRRITTVRDAVILLGFRAVRSATLASCVIDAIPAGRQTDRTAFWHYAVAVGLLAEMLAHTTRRHHDEAFTAGVLHNIGRLALSQHRPEGLERARALAQQHDISVHAAEREIFGFTDAELGGGMALVWNFPAELAEAVARHHLDPADLPDPDSLAGYVVRARLFARSAGIHDGLEPAASGDTPEEWSTPPLSSALKVNGGLDELRKRVDVFVDHTLGHDERAA
jgi:HD-like signal output (HDOD) protein